MLAETMLADLRGLHHTATFLAALPEWRNPCTYADIPVQPVRVNLPTWFLPTFCNFISYKLITNYVCLLYDMK